MVSSGAQHICPMFYYFKIYTLFDLCTLTLALSRFSQNVIPRTVNIVSEISEPMKQRLHILVPINDVP